MENTLNILSDFCEERGTSRRFSVRKSVLRNFAKYTGKQLYQGLFFNKAAGLRLQLYQKRDPDTGVFLLILQNF